VGSFSVNTPLENSVLLKELLHKLGDVVHEYQRERGCAGLFLDSLGKIFTKRFDAQVAASNESVAILRAFCDRADVKDALPPSFSARLQYLFVKYEETDELRDEIRLLSVRYTGALNNYTFNLTVPTIDAMIELAQRSPTNNSALVSGYANFLQWKERIGMERALGTRGFYTFAFRNQEFCDRFVALIAEQKNYFNTFKALASPAQIALVNEYLTDKGLLAFQEFNKLLEDGAPTSEIEQFTGEHWFELCTRIIDNLSKTEKQLVEGLTGAALMGDKESDAPADPRKTTSAPAQVQKYRKLLAAMPTFSTLEEEDLDELLSFAQVREYSKDKLLFLRDEPASRIYIILQGWVKVYNGLETGEEAILQMLGAGETLLESAVFLNVPTPVSAQVVEDALLLSIPAPVLRQRIQSSPQLAISMLNSVSLRSQRLVQQLELSRLKSAQERVGWFLLRLMLNQKSEGGLIYLPYEKSIIASYLDMRPETFSRTLKKFKADGFHISSDTVQIPEEQALCGFCDIDLANQCNRAGGESCPHPEFSDELYQAEA
jgi:CRP-like cAMP-binding protein